MKVNTKKMLLMLLTLYSLSIVCNENKILTFCPIKGENFGLSREFLTQIKNMFNPSVFIETGTYLGYTTEIGAEIFECVYSVELGKDIYQKTLARFKDSQISNIYLFNNNSPDFLKEVLPQINQPMVLFLDAHWWANANTARGDSNTPVLDELAMIKKYRTHDCIIMIDDIRCFRPELPNMAPSHYDYPTIDILINKGKEIFEELGFVVFGDILIMYDSKAHNIKTSEVLYGLTRYKIESLQESISQETIESLYKDISSANNLELDGINWLMNLTKSPSRYLYEDFLIWNLITSMHSCNYTEALSILNILKNKTCSILNYQLIQFISNKHQLIV